MRILTITLVVLLGILVEAGAQSVAVPISNGRINRTIDVMDFNDFKIYLPNETTEVSFYVQWSNNSIVVADDVTLLCLNGPDGSFGGEDDDITFSGSRQTSYEIEQGRMWYTTTVSGQRCWLTIDFQHRDSYDRSASATFTIILSAAGVTEGTWPLASAAEMQQMTEKSWRAGRQFIEW